MEVIDSKHQSYIENIPKLLNKLSYWDRVRSGGWNNDKEAVLMLTDPSVYAYAFLKDDEDNFFKVTAYQDLILNCKHDFTAMGENRFILFLAANQIGKSQTLVVKAIHIVNTEDNKNIVIVSKSLPQSQFVLGQIKLMLNRSLFSGTWQEELGDQANTTILTFSRNEGKVVNRIICAPAGEGLLGYPVHYLFLDELDFYDDAKKFFYKVAISRTNKTKGQIIGFSNSNPDISKAESLMYELWVGELFKKKFKFTFLDAPWNTIEEYERNKKNIPSYVFKSTYDGEFSQDAGSFFSEKELDWTFRKDWVNNLPIVDCPVYLAVDFGKVKDNTVISLGIVRQVDGVDYLDVKYVQEFPLKTPYIVVLERIKEINEYYAKNFFGVAGIGFDKTGVGTAMSEFVSLEKDLGVTDIVWSSERRTKLFADFKLLVENKRLNVVYTDETYKQFAGLNITYTPKGFIKVENKEDSIHDDHPSSIVMLIAVAMKPKMITPGFSFVGNEPDKKEKKETEGGWSFDLSEEDMNEISEVENLKKGVLV